MSNEQFNQNEVIELAVHGIRKAADENYADHKSFLRGAVCGMQMMSGIISDPTKSVADVIGEVETDLLDRLIKALIMESADA